MQALHGPISARALLTQPNPDLLRRGQAAPDQPDVRQHRAGVEAHGQWRQGGEGGVVADVLRLWCQG